MNVRTIMLSTVYGLSVAMIGGIPAYAQTSAPATVAGIEASWLKAPARPNLNFSPTSIPSRQSMMSALDYVAAAQIADMSRRPIQLSTGSNLSEISSNWVAATFYVGAARLARESDNKDILRFLTATAEHYNYAFRGARAERLLLNADDVAIGDLYQEIYARRGQQGVIMPLQQRLDYMVPHLNRVQETESLIWWWCDALYMAPPVLARQTALTGDMKYLRAMDKEWRRTAARLWVEDDSLFLRDERFKDEHHKGATGQPIYWSRGNGWVMGGLARTLESMPADFEGREFYVTTFTKMAGRIKELQRSDGLWSTDLNDPKSFPEAETSGSAFFVYALAWGINHGLLDRATYQPTVLKGWAALNKHVLPNGLIGAAQKTGDRPVPTKAEDVGPYATGAYLLAGIEIMNLGKPAQALPEAEPSRDDEATILATTPQPIAPVTVIGDEEKKRRDAEMKATRALAYDPATLKRPAAVEKLTPPADQTPRAVARFAPERFDDLLWENDKVAHRIYGPALQAREAPSGSGIDVWAKRVRYPYMDRQLKFPNYHVDRGEGLDYYDVGRGRGAGGLGIWYDNKLWTSRNFTTYEILKTGADEAKFKVDYRPWPVDVARKVWETRTFSLPLGSNFTRMTSTISSDTKDPLIVAIGITKRKGDAGNGIVTKDAKSGTLSFWEPASVNGSIGITIAADPAMVEGFTEDAENYLILLRVTPGKPFSYYMGSAWDGGLDFKSREAWDAFVKSQTFSFAPIK
ncbi:glycoside hydrolase family 88 protein [Asticcacaulis sp. ZE23SCel15]|uniref:glycoside hydrolase family 88 protein n=1 Tax=Asticcacaulis sp. ZE23SCel15 TaxID=3059027 RepID=UPI00265E5E23|nr:glycoside hydrolase family 88 protein [Asticcacaulis sp. ZE23SCel15]WKL57316.1 glycoside hydrolase family 88 protein [Asticcacaulis sp. ZE23SCel15]